ncbi:hypothetical protein [uncultured Bacteroides sp.]|uniref:hypothetical protein n=1 Tax=uncultured Bacteroides sp. TaxID=162156 RepID=UPI002AAA68BD|nr:hypothetical protein [uncultured Bacteroides sp.]
MPIEKTTSEKAIEEAIKKAILENEKEVLKGLSLIGEECRNNARLNRGYKDQTGNLNSSIGWVVLKDGHPEYEGGLVSTPSGSEEGAKGQIIGAEMLDKWSSEFKEGYVLLLVAGMNYASFVQNGTSRMPGRNVLKSAELIVQGLMDELMQNIMKNNSKK